MRRVLVPHAIATPAPPAGHMLHALGGPTMGTSWSMQLCGPPGLDLAALRHGIEQQLDAVVAQMSHWDPQSTLSRFNGAAAGHWQALPPAFAEVLQFALAVAAESGGAFDPTAGALVNLWGFGATGRHDEPGWRLPMPGSVAAARACSGWQRLQFDAGTARACQPGGLQLDLSAVAKGYAVDRMAGHLQAAGLGHHLVEVGGELRGAGMKPDGQPWWVLLEPPPAQPGTAPAAGAPGPTETLVALHGLSVATSGDYRRFHRPAPGEDQRQASQGHLHRPHTIDPRTGQPITHGVASVTVLHPQCMAADAWSTALTVLGPQEGPACAERQGLAALFVTRRHDGTLDERMTSAFAALAQ